jgi:glycosyltransferase involved in cell wall biosynthesis
VDSLRNATNLGVGASRNILLDWMQSLGPVWKEDLVSFVDADDLLEPTAMRSRVAGFERWAEVDCLGGQLELFYAEGQSPHAVTTFPLDPQLQRIADLFECHFYGANCTFRASVFARPDLRWPQTRRSDDWMFFAMHPELNKRHLPNVTLRYRRHARSITSSVAGLDALERLRWSIRVLGLAPLGVVPSVEQFRMMDAVGYLSFRMRWKGLSWEPAPEAHMPWFPYLSQNTQALRNPKRFLQETGEFFSELSAENDRAGAFDRRKFRAFLRALLDSARNELISALS